MAGPQHPPPSLSPTRIKTYQRCPLAYRYRYIDMVAAPPSPASLLGHCLHAAIEANFRAKRRTRRDSSEAELGQVFDREWDAGLPPAGELVRGTPEEFAEVREEGYQLIRFYIDNVASAIRPHLVEHRFRFRIDGLPAEVVGQVDLIESDGTVVDHKSSVHPYSEDYLDNDVQLLCYSIGYGVFREGVRLRPGALPPASRLTRARVAGRPPPVSWFMSIRFFPRARPLCPAIAFPCLTRRAMTGLSRMISGESTESLPSLTPCPSETWRNGILTIQIRLAKASIALG